MTTREKAIGVLAATAGGALLAAALLLLQQVKGFDDESGIRVKNGGSVEVTTESQQGFTWARWWHWKSKGKSKGSFSVSVSSADCGSGPSELTQVTKVVVGVPTGTLALEDRGNHIHVDVSWLWWWANGGKISHGDDLFLLKSVEASGMDANGNAATLRCSFVGDSKVQWVDLDLP